MIIIIIIKGNTTKAPPPPILNFFFWVLTPTVVKMKRLIAFIAIILFLSKIDCEAKHPNLFTIESYGNFEPIKFNLAFQMVIKCLAKRNQERQMFSKVRSFFSFSKKKKSFFVYYFSHFSYFFFISVLWWWSLQKRNRFVKKKWKNQLFSVFFLFKIWIYY